MRQLHPSDKVQLTVRIPKRLRRAVRIDCVARGITVQAWTREAFREYLDGVTTKSRTGRRGIS
jgi:predicted DNA binding CopG/RHH family protein